MKLKVAVSSDWSMHQAVKKVPIKTQYLLYKDSNMAGDNSETVFLMVNTGGTGEHFQQDSWSKGLVVRFFLLYTAFMLMVLF